jgi:hypothetical protein
MDDKLTIFMAVISVAVVLQMVFLAALCFTLHRLNKPTHCPCGSLTTESRKGCRQGGCPPGRSAYRCPLLGFDLPAENRRSFKVLSGGMP